MDPTNQAGRAAPATALTWLAAADTLHADRKFAEAIAHYREAVQRDSGLYLAWYGLGCALFTSDAFADAIVALRRAVGIDPMAMPARATLGESLYALGHVTASTQEYARVASDGDATLRALALSNIACIAPGDPALDNQGILDVRRRWMEAEAAAIRPLGTPRRGAEGKLRIAYLSAFFGSRNWMKGYMGVINAHDRDRFEVYLIADRSLPSAEAGYRDHDEDHIWNVSNVSNERLARIIADARLDILVDLNGYSFQRRLPLFVYRAAPVQISWVGMYGTTGIAAMDCVVGDLAVIPPEEERFCVERVRRVPHTYLAFDMFYPVPDVAPPPYRAAGHVTFGSLVSAYKITNAVIAAWSRILLGVPGSRLLLRNRAFDHPCNNADFAARFSAHGIRFDRLILEGGAEHFEFLRTYDRIDIALDAFPYNGGTTTAEAIWQGVPLLTFNGDRWAGRTSRSILAAAGLGAWAAVDEAAFVTMAIGMGQSPERHADLRPGQCARIAASPAFDTVGLCRELEAIYEAEFAAKS